MNRLPDTAGNPQHFILAVECTISSWLYTVLTDIQNWTSGEVPYKLADEENVSVTLFMRLLEDVWLQ